MSELILIRHGQATPFAKDTDQLSPLGEQQAQAIGQALAPFRPTHVIHGPLVRQRRTAQLAGQVNTWPTLIEEARLAEFDGDGLLRTLAPLLAEQDPAFAALVNEFKAKRDTPQRNAAFQCLLEALVEAWREGKVLQAEVESWDSFRQRVREAFLDLLRLPSGSRVLAFTSGGVIGLSVALALDAPDSAALKLNWRVKNGSLTRFTFGGGRVSLDTFNETGHLGAELQSWR